MSAMKKKFRNAGKKARKALRKASGRVAKDAPRMAAGTVGQAADQWSIDPAKAWIGVFPGLENFARLDPYLIWAASTGFADMDGVPKDFFPISMEIKATPDPLDASLPTTAAAFAEQIAAEDFIWMSGLYRSQLPVLAPTRFCTAHVRADFFQRLSPALRGRIERFTLGLPIVTGWPARAQPAKPAQLPLVPVGLNSDFGHTVVAVIDDGIGFANVNFHEDASLKKSRVRCFWNQDDDPAAPAAGLGYGREYLGTEIESLMAQANTGGGFNETALYRRADYHAVERCWTHGTATMDLAAGHNPQCPAKPDPAGPIKALIGVQFRLPGRTIRDTSGLWLDAQAIDAFRYVVDRAHQLIGPGGCVFINLSYGYIAGPHDGSSLIEGAMDELAGTSACYIAVPAGNSNLARCHGQLELAPREKTTMRWRVLPDCKTPSFVEIWLPDGGPDITVSIEPPDGPASGPIASGNVATLTRNGSAICTVVHRGRGARGDGRMVLIALAPTVLSDRTRTHAPNGNWNIQVKNTSKTAGLTVNAWVQRNDTPENFPPRARQSRFDDDAYPRFNRFGEEQDVDDDLSKNSWIRHANTLNSIATGQYTAVVAGHRWVDLATARYSGSGGIAPGAALGMHKGPDATESTDVSAALPGVYASGTKSRSVFSFVGTSAAAPQAVRKDAATYAILNPVKPGAAAPPTRLRQATRTNATPQSTLPPPNAAIRWATFDQYDIQRRTTDGNVGAGNIREDLYKPACDCANCPAAKP